MEDLGLLQLADTVLLSEEEGVEKPSCEMFQRAYRRIGVKPEETVHVGDELEWWVRAEYHDDIGADDGPCYNS